MLLKLCKFLYLIPLLSLTTCIDPYVPKLQGYESLLVVDGMITNSDLSYKVKLSRTFQDLNLVPEGISDATVSISDDAGNNYQMIYSGNGIYKTDSTNFRGIAGRVYTLHIKTGNNEYESDPCLLQPVAEIDSVYFGRATRMINNNTESQDGIMIYLDSNGNENNKYYLWTYDETWQFKVPHPQKYEYIHGPDGNHPIFLEIKEGKEYCWKNSSINDILIRSLNESPQRRIERQTVTFIAPEESDRLLLDYSILVSQYSISKDEYDFWNNLKQVNATGGDIFAKQPYSVVSNIHNIKDPGERVLGFFRVSAVSQKRIFINIKDVSRMGFHLYAYPCKAVQFEPANFQGLGTWPPKTWDDVYEYLCILDTYTFTRPIYNGTTLVKLEFSTPECADCELTGTRTKPDFWIEDK